MNSGILFIYKKALIGNQGIIFKTNKPIKFFQKKKKKPKFIQSQVYKK
jgi:hypothetical protein